MAAAKRKTGAGKPGAKADAEARILARALKIADQTGWDGLRLRDLADQLGMSMAGLRGHVRDQDAIADLWFRRALDAMLAPTPKGFFKRRARDRIAFLLWRWFDALAPHRRLTAEMVRAKMWIFHPHHYGPMVFHLSRLIQLVRDGAGLEASGRRRQIEEVGLSALFLATLALWCRDESTGQERTRAFLERRLAEADRLMARLYGRAPGRSRGRPANDA